MKAESRVQEVDGVVIKTYGNRSQSDNKPFVVFNGIGCGVNNWGNLLETLDRDIYAIDVKDAKKLGHTATMSDYANIATEVISELADKPVDLLGYSWGGLLAQQLTINKPKSVDKLVLAATAPGSLWALPSLHAAYGMLTPNRSPEHLQKVGGRMYGGDILKNPQLIEELGLVREINPESYRRQQAAAFMATCLDNLWFATGYRKLSQINNPTLIMAGTDDPVIPYANAIAMKNIIPNAKLHTIEEGGHAFLLTQSETSANVINAFLDEPQTTPLAA